MRDHEQPRAAESGRATRQRRARERQLEGACREDEGTERCVSSSYPRSRPPRVVVAVVPTPLQDRPLPVPSDRVAPLANRITFVPPLRSTVLRSDCSSTVVPHVDTATCHLRLAKPGGRLPPLGRPQEASGHLPTRAARRLP